MTQAYKVLGKPLENGSPRQKHETVIPKSVM